MDVKGTLAEYGLTEELYEAMLKDISDKTNKCSDLEWADIVDKYNMDMHYDTLRKGATPPLFGGVFVKEYFEDKIARLSIDGTDTSYVDDKIHELQKERVLIRDERNELNKVIRSEARLKDRLDKIEDAIVAQGREQYEIPNVTEINSDNDVIVTLADLHIGAEYYSFGGVYNSDIAKDRLNKYLEEIIKIKKRHNSQNCYVVMLGDQISGNIHRTIAVSNREDVIQQVMKASALVVDFVYELSKVFTNVHVNSVNGNHSRLSTKEDSVKDERLDSLIPWYLEAKLGHIPNIKVENENIDSTISMFTVRDKIYIGVHGDNDFFSDAGAARLSMFLGFIPYCIISGHKHFPAMNECSGIQMIQVGSLGGSGDDYTIQKRLRGQASQTILVCNNDGIEAYYPVKF